MAELNVRMNLSFGARSMRCLMIAAMLFSAATEVASESLTLTTYYPAPSGVYAQMITTGNTFLARDSGGVTIGGTGGAPAGGLSFGALNPTIQAGSYIIMPGGLYVNGGTAYFANTIQTRGGIHDDSNGTLSIYGGTSGNTAVTGALSVGGSETVNGAVTADAYLPGPGYTSWAAYGTGAGGAAIYNDGAGYGALMIVGNASQGHERIVKVWDSFLVNGQITTTDSSCQEVSYNINGVTTCAAAGYGGPSYVAVQAGIISYMIVMPYYTNPAGQQQGGLAPMLCCACPASGCPL